MRYLTARWLLKSRTERNGMERFRLLKYGTHGTKQSRNSHGTVSFASLASMALIMACSLSMTRGYFALRMAGMSCTHCLKSSLCVFTNLRSWIKNIAGMTHTRSGNVWIYRMLFHGGCTCRHGKCGAAVVVCGEDSGAASCCVGL